MKSDAVLNLEEALSAILQVKEWLLRSYEMSPEPLYANDLAKSDWDTLEALSCRFARLSDLLIQKLFRAIDRAKLQGPGSLIDVVNRAEKRGLNEGVDCIRNIRDLRNEIAHEYKINDLLSHYAEIYKSTPVLFQMIERAQAYVVERFGLWLTLPLGRL